MSLTQERLKELVDYNPDTGVFVRRATAYKALAGSVAGCMGSKGYLQFMIDKKMHLCHRLAWLWVHGSLPKNQIDHINRIKTDNRIENLRDVSQYCNMRNCGTRDGSDSGVKGVSWYRATSKWRAHIRVNNKDYHLGLYCHKDNAICARLAAEQCLNWVDQDIKSPALRYVKNLISRRGAK